MLGMLKNDGSEIFKESVVEYMDNNRERELEYDDIKVNFFYGYSITGAFFVSKSPVIFGSTSKELTIKEFIELSKK